jgi:outer membrane biosynthesis protein TonB
VPDATKFLEKMSKVAAQCVADHGGLSGAKGEMKVQFLVTVRGKAEGVEVLSSKGVTELAAKCVRDAIREKSVGMPTADPTGVQFHYRFSP